MLNTRNEENNTEFDSYLACFVNTPTLNMYVSECGEGVRVAEAEQVTWEAGRRPYILNTRNEEHNTGFDSYVACFVNTPTLTMYVSMSYTGLTRRNTVFMFLWLRHRNT